MSFRVAKNETEITHQSCVTSAGSARINELIFQIMRQHNTRHDGRNCLSNQQLPKYTRDDMRVGLNLLCQYLKLVCVTN